MVVYEVRRVRYEQELKLSFIYDKLPEGDLHLSGDKLFKLLVGSIVGGLFGAMGLGGGVVFNPTLLSLGIPPSVVAATGMYLIMYNQASNSVTYALSGDLNIGFAAWIGACSCIGILFCLYAMKNLIQRTGRQSLVVLVLSVVMLLSALMIPLISIPKLIAREELGLNIWAFSNPCTTS